jgi:hypothetical protein
MRKEKHFQPSSAKVHTNFLSSCMCIKSTTISRAHIILHNSLRERGRVSKTDLRLEMHSRKFGCKRKRAQKPLGISKQHKSKKNFLDSKAKPYKQHNNITHQNYNSVQLSSVRRVCIQKLGAVFRITLRTR